MVLLHGEPQLLDAHRRLVEPAPREHVGERGHAVEETGDARVLGEVSERALSMDDTTGRGSRTSEDAEQARLARTVATDEADLVTGAHGERGAFDDKAPADFHRELAGLQHEGPGYGAIPRFLGTVCTVTGHDHDHGHSHARAGARHEGALRSAFFLILGFLVVQVVTGIVTGSLALLSDAGHMATDALGLGMALAAIHAASRARTDGQRTFGLYRLEILAALANAVLLFGVAAWVLYEAIVRLGEDREIASLPVLVVGVIGLVVNLIALMLLRPGADESLNLKGASIEVLSDTIGSVGVIVAAIVWGSPDGHGSTR